MAHYSRRDFLKTGLAAAALAGVGSFPLRAAPETATDWVTLGKSGVKVTRLAFGTGTMSGRVQRELGQEQFTRLVRYAYDRGIRFFETAESYGDMHRMLGVALNGIPRDSYRLMSKITTHGDVDPQAEDRRAAQTREHRLLRRDAAALAAYADLAHRQPPMAGRHYGGPDETCGGKSRRVGARPSGVAPVPGKQWLQVAMIRMNHKGVRMDAEDYNTDGSGNVSEVVTHVKQVRGEGMGVISMKLVGEGCFTNREDRQAAMRFAFRMRASIALRWATRIQPRSTRPSRI